MNIQIYGTKKSSDTRKAERFFKERGIKFQSIDLKEKGLSKGEFNAVMQAIIVIGVAAIVPHNAMADSLMDDISFFVEENTEAEIIDEEREISQRMNVRKR